MIGVYVRFQFNNDFNPARLYAIAEKARFKFEGMPGLISKAFTINTEQRAAINFYIWESKAAAQAFYTDTMLEQVSSLYGVKPTLEYVDIAQHVNNAN